MAAMQPRVLETVVTQGDVEEFEKLISYWPDFSSAASASSNTTKSHTPSPSSSSSTANDARSQHMRHAFSYGRLLWTSVHQRTPITKNIVLDPAIFRTPVRLDGIAIKLKVFLDLVVALQPAAPLADPTLADDVGMEALAPIAASVAREFAVAHRVLYKNFSGVPKPVAVPGSVAGDGRGADGGADAGASGDSGNSDGGGGGGRSGGSQQPPPKPQPPKQVKPTKTAFGSFFSKLKKDFKKGFTEMQLGVQRIARDGVDLLQPGASGRHVDNVQQYRRLLHQLCRGLFSIGHMYKFVLSVQEKCEAEDAANAGVASTGGDVALQQAQISAQNERRQTLRAAAVVVRDIDKISTFFADVVWPLLLKDIITMAKRYVSDQGAALL